MMVNNVTITTDKHEQDRGSPEACDLFGISLLENTFFFFFFDEGEVAE